MSVTMKDNTDSVLSGIDDAVWAALEKVGIHLEGEAKEELEVSPRRVDTGLLRNSITYAVAGQEAHIKSYEADKPSSKNGEAKSGRYSGTAPTDPQGRPCVYIGSNLEYADYVHEGTQKMAPNRFLTNAVTRNRSQIVHFLQNELSDNRD